jgi:hypothetical protein
MRTKRSVAAVAAALGLFLPMLACQTSPSATPAPTVVAETAPTAVPSPPAAPPADHIKLQHVLISFAGKVPGKNVTRSREEARALAAQILDRARKGEDFDELVRAHTDDRAPGIYALSNSGVAPAAGEFSRDRMVPAFGDVGFALAPGQIGMAEYDPVKSPYGWHIIKRLE